MDLILQPEDNRRLANLCGQMDLNIREIERRLGIEISSRGNVFKLRGTRTAVNGACEVLKDLYDVSNREAITP
ncbi:MAG TPA: phosphate starvation-inducible protein PhoH, partial [Gammaproteobacteria bacterium]